MGIPKFFRWLSERYALVNQMMSEAEPPEFDNLYLDMNGIIHHCSHPFEDSTKNVLTEKEMFISIVHYVDRLLHIVKPRKLLYLAIDGVAPRAKMNQQRQRRFRSARDAAEALADLQAKGHPAPKDKPFDSNCITPGTDFMHTLSLHLHFFIRKKLSEDNRWKKIKIFSGHDVPGEGEHKIMEYIRHCKAQPGWEPNQTHCMYGLDADLIMLALASHEPHFSLLRENVLTKQKRGNKTKITGETSQADLEFHFLHLSMVREYLDVEHSNLNLSFKYDLERIVDDFILLCYFVGNDFLPHNASLDIAEGGLNTMLTLYKTILPSLGGYLVEDAEINWDRLEQFITHLAKIERKLMEGVPLGDFFEEQANNDIENEKEFNDGEGTQNETAPPRSKSLEKMILDNEEEDNNDTSGDYEWKDTYYKERFEGKLSMEAREGEFSDFHHHLRRTYIEGLAWVMKYYFRGCVSWEWFYPYFYAPLFSDLVNLSSYKISFSLGSPFTPYQQLLGVLPAASAPFLPPPYQVLMTSPSSPIIDFYPEDFKIGKKNPWEGIVLVPFIDQARLLAACATINEDSLTQLEKDRNRLGVSHLMVYDGQSHGKYESPAHYLSDINDCHISCTVYTLPPISPDSHPFRILPDAKTGLESPSGIPTLKTSEFSTSYVHAKSLIKDEIFGFPSKQDNLILKLPAPQQHTAGDPEVTQLIGSRCYVNWPYLVEAIVVGASDASCKYFSPQHVYNNKTNSKSYNSTNTTVNVNNSNPNGDSTPTSGNNNEAGDSSNSATPAPTPSVEIKKVANTAEATGYFKKDAEWYQNKLIMKKGIDVGQIEVMLHVRLLEGLETTELGEKTKKYSAVETQWPIQLHKSLSVLPPDSRYSEVIAPALDVRFPPTLPILYMGPQYTGSLGNVQLVSADNTMIVSVDAIAAEPRFGAKIATQTAENYYQLNQVARRVNISPRNLSKLTGSVYFEPGRFNLGLNIKFSGKNLQVPGYTRKLGEGPWEFSERAIQLIADYKAKFPRVFDLLDLGEEPFVKDLLPPTSKSNKNGAPLRTSANQGASTPPTDSASPASTSTSESTPNGASPNSEKSTEPNPHQIAQSIQAWLRSLPTESLEKVPCGCEAMTREGIKQVESYVGKLSGSMRKKILRNVPAQDIVGPREDPIPFTAEFSLGDRVVNALDNTPIPFGIRGTIVSVKGKTLDVVFDEDFVGGSTLDGACSEFRGKNVSVHSVYNITRFTGRPHIYSAPPQSRAWNNNNNNGQSPKGGYSQKHMQPQSNSPQQPQHLQQQFQQMQIQSPSNAQHKSKQPQDPLQPPQQQPQQQQQVQQQHNHQHKGNNKPQKAYKPKVQQSNSPTPQPDAPAQASSDSIDLAKAFKQALAAEDAQTPSASPTSGLDSQQQPQQAQQPRQQRAQQRRQAKQQNANSPQSQPVQSEQFPQQPELQQQVQSQAPMPYQSADPADQKDALTWQQQMLQPRGKPNRQNQNRGNARRGPNSTAAQQVPQAVPQQVPNPVLAPPITPALFVPGGSYPAGFAPPPFMPAPMLNPNLSANPPYPHPQHIPMHAPHHAHPHMHPHAQQHHAMHHQQQHQQQAHRGGRHGRGQHGHHGHHGHHGQQHHSAPQVAVPQAAVPQQPVPQAKPPVDPLKPPVNPNILQPYSSSAPHAAPRSTDSNNDALNWQQQLLMGGGGKRGGRGGGRGGRSLDYE